jgi:hypothetical protein
MPFGSSQWMYASGGFYNNLATQSLRFDDGSSAYLTRTPSSAGNRKTFTFSAWVKRANIGLAHSYLIDVNESGGRENPITLSSDVLRFSMWNGSTDVFNLTTNRLFRDVSAWYHIVVAVDTTQATESNRIKIYINGVQETSFSTETYPSLNSDLDLNSASAHNIGRWVSGTSRYFDGYMAEVNLVDGQALTPTSFGETKNGVWIPIEYTGSYGTNGFRLQFNQTGTGTASSSTIGADTSGNNHHFTSSGIVASDCNMLDSPENNFCTLNSLQISNNDSNFFPSEGNLQLSANSNSGYRNCSSTFSPMGFKGYFEFTGTATMNFYLGPIEDTTHPTNADYADGNHNFLYLISDGQVQKNQGGTAGQVVRSASDHALGTISTGDVLGIAFDFTGTNRNVWFHRANTYGTASSGVGNPATGANPIGTSSILDSAEPYRFNFGINNGARLHFNFGQDSSFAGNKTAQGNTDENGNGDFYYAPPSGFLALCTANLPEPTISPNETTQADDYFNTLLYTGDGNNTRSITGVGFQPDWVWLKRRSSAQNHRVFDIVRGSTEGLYTNLTDAEGSSQDVNGVLSSFDSDGFSTVNGSSGVNAVNQNNETYVAWNWKAGGTAVSNTDGSITSSVSANTDAGFSVVSYTGNGNASETVGHGLNTTPEMVIVKKRSTTSSWYVAHYSLDNSYNYAYHMFLNSTTAKSGNDDPYFLGSGNTSSVINVLNYNGGNGGNESGTDYIAYCFADVEGYSRFGSYTGNGSTDGSFVYTGFRPAFLMVKVTNISGENWHMFDSTRAPYNVVVPRLIADGSTAENNNDNIIDFTSNGFKWRDSNPGYNGNNNTYIYMVFAENPFKYANAR